MDGKGEKGIEELWSPFPRIHENHIKYASLRSHPGCFAYPWKLLHLTDELWS